MLNLKATIGFLISAIWLLGACAPPPSQELPTLVRIPDIDTATPDMSLADASALRTPLPASFTPTFTATTTPTLDPSITATISPTVTVTPSMTITNTSTPTPTDAPTLRPEDRPILAFALTAYAATVLPQDYQVPNFGGAEITLIPQATGTLDPNAPIAIPPLSTGGVPATGIATSNCPTVPAGGFGTLFQNNPTTATQLGCPIGAIQSIPSAWQNFETGVMVWLNGEVLVFYTLNGSFQSVPDTFAEGVDPETTSETPPAGLIAPIRGFLKVWSNDTSVRSGLGWATTGEAGTTATVQNFSNGRMIFIPGRTDVLVLIGTAQTGTWVSLQGSY